MTRHHISELLFSLLNKFAQTKGHKIPQNGCHIMILTEAIVRNGNEKAIVVGYESYSVSQANQTAAVT